MTHLTRRAFLGSSAALAGAGAIAVANSRAAAAEKEFDDPRTLGKTPHTKFAVNCEMWFGKLPYAERLRRAAALGFPAVELWPWQNKNVDEIAALSQELGIAIAQFTAWGFSPGLNDPKNHDA